MLIDAIDAEGSYIYFGDVVLQDAGIVDFKRVKAIFSGNLATATGGTVINAAFATIEFTDDAKITAKAGDVFIVSKAQREAALVANKAGGNLAIVPKFVTIAELSDPEPADDDVVLGNLRIGGDEVSPDALLAFAGIHTVYVAGDLSINNGSDRFDTGIVKLVALRETTVEGTGNLTLGFGTEIGTLKAGNSFTIDTVGNTVSTLDLNGKAVTINDPSNIENITSSASDSRLVLKDTPTPIERITVGAHDIRVSAIGDTDETKLTALTLNHFSASRSNLVLPASVVMFDAGSGGGNIHYAENPAGLTLSSTDGLTHDGELNVTGDLTTTLGSLKVEGNLTTASGTGGDGDVSLRSDLTVTGTASFAGTLANTGAATFTFTGATTVTGALTVGSPLTIAGTGPVTLTAASTITNAPLTVTNSGGVTPDGGITVGTLGGLTISGDGKVVLPSSSGSGNSFITVQASGTVVAGEFLRLGEGAWKSFTDGDGLTTIEANKITLAAGGQFGNDSTKTVLTGGSDLTGGNSTNTFKASGEAVTLAQDTTSTPNKLTITGAGADAKLEAGPKAGIYISGVTLEITSATVDISMSSSGITLDGTDTTSNGIAIDNNNPAGTILLDDTKTAASIATGDPGFNVKGLDLGTDVTLKAENQALNEFIGSFSSSGSTNTIKVDSPSTTTDAVTIKRGLKTGT
jgi:hypothetical protein